MSDTTILEQIRDGIAALNQGKALVSSSSGGGSTGGDTKNLLSAITQTTTAFLGVSSAGQELRGALTGVASVIPGKLGSATTSFINSMEDARQANIQNAKQGIGGLALFDLPSKTREIGLGADEYRQILNRSGNALNGLGGTAQSGSEKLLKFGAEIQETNIGKNLLSSGAIAKDEFQKLAALSQYGTKVNLDDAAQRTKSANAAAMFADEIVKTSAITGRSREAIAAELEERLKSPVVLGQLNQMTEEQRQSFVRSQAQLAGMGNTVQDLSATLGTGGRLSKEQNMQLAAMGPAAGEFTRASRMAATAQDENEKRQAALAMESAKAKINEYQSSAQFANIMKSATPEVAKFYQEQYKENQLRGRQAAEQRDTGLTGTAALDAQRTQVSRVVAGQTAAGAPDPNQGAQRLMTEAQLKAQANTAGLLRSMQGLETQFGSNEKAAQSLRKYMDLAFGSGSVAERKEFYDKQAANVLKELEGAGTANKRAEGATAPGASLPSPPPLKKHAFGGISDIPAMFGEAGPEAAVPLPDGRRIPVDLNIGDALAKMQQAMNTGMANATAAVSTAIPTVPRQTSTESSGGVTMNDLLKAMQEVNKNIMRMASNTDDMVTHTKNTARATKASSGSRNV
jgi:hypothetical protein